MSSDGRRTTRPRARGLVSLAIAVLPSAGCGGGDVSESSGPAPVDRPPTRVLVVDELTARYPAGATDVNQPDPIENAIGLTVDGESVYVLDALARSVLRFDLEATLLARFGKAGGGPGELQSPLGIAVDPEGNVWVSDPASNRVSRFAPDGEFLESRTTDAPPVNFTVTALGDVVYPSMDASRLLVRATVAGPAPVEVDRVPPEVSRDPRDRISLFGLPLAGLDDGSVAMLRNRNGTDYRMWHVSFSSDGGTISTIDDVAFPLWFQTIMEEEERATRESAPEELLRDDFLVPFKGMHVVAGHVWLIPTLSSHAIAFSVPLTEDQDASAVVGDPEAFGGLVDATVVDDRLIVLASTELRVYSLKPHDGPFPRR